MSLNDHMHSRNIYKGKPPDFAQLSKLYPKFAPFVQTNKSGKAYVDFRDPASVRELAVCLLHKDFGYKVELPDNRLSPAIPSRLNYILWMEDLLNSVTTNQERVKFKVIDIGTGCTCIYPLLGVHVNPKITFTATEIDETNFKFAKKNVEANNLGNCIEVCEVEPTIKTLLTHIVGSESDRYDCCICNPPFFKDESDALCGNRGFVNSSCLASNTEAITEGGDLEFAERLYQESLALKDKLIWYTIMFGKKSSFRSFKRKFTDTKSIVTASYEFCQGNTIRWGFAWSFTPELIDITKIPSSPFKISSKSKKLLKPISFYIESPTIESGKMILLSIFDELLIKVDLLSSEHRMASMNATAFQNTWVGSRHRARKRKHCDVTHDVIEAPSELSDPVLTFHVELTENVAGSTLVSLKIENQSQKEVLNSLVVHIKRLLVKRIENNSR